MKADPDQKAPEAEIQKYQQLLDRCFPIGAFCVEFEEEDGRLRTTGRELVTGRVLCTDATRNGSGTWRHRILIDPRTRPDGGDEPLEAWISSLVPHHEISDLWEASVITEGPEERTLRLLSDPEPPWRPTPRMRSAVSKAHGIA